MKEATQSPAGPPGARGGPAGLPLLSGPCPPTSAHRPPSSDGRRVLSSADPSTGGLELPVEGAFLLTAGETEARAARCGRSCLGATLPTGQRPGVSSSQDGIGAGACAGTEPVCVVRAGQTRPGPTAQHSTATGRCSRDLATRGLWLPSWGLSLSLSLLLSLLREATGRTPHVGGLRPAGSRVGAVRSRPPLAFR